MREAHVPAQQPEAQEEARVPHPDAHPRGARGAPLPSGPGPFAPRRLIWRVRNRANFRVLAGRPRDRAGPLWLRTARRDDGGPPAVAFAIGRPVGNAPARNRLRRRLRAAVRAHAPDLLPGHDHLIGAAPAAVHLDHAGIEDLVRRLLAAARARAEAAGGPGHR